MSENKYTKEVVCICCQNIFETSKYKNSHYCSKKCQFHKELVLKNSDIEIINGSLLSDGSITKSKKNTNFQLKHTCKYFEYVEFIKRELSFNTKIYSMNTHDAHTLCSPTHHVFTELRKKWYPNGKKIVPGDLTITPTVLLHWFLGDGNYNKSHGITLCTDSFPEKDVLMLINKINKNYNIESYHRKKRNRIIIPNRCAFEFFDIIGQSPVFCYLNKWDISIVESYFNRTCLNNNCANKFNAQHNHQKHCSEKCYKQSWYKKHKLTL